MRRKLLATCAAVTASALSLGVGTTFAQGDSEATGSAPEVGFDFGAGQEIARGLSNPWGMAFLPGQITVVADRDSGAVLTYAGFGNPEVIGGIPVPPSEGPFDERGLLGLAVSPDYEEDGYIYAYHSTEEDNRVVRFTIDTVDSPEPVVTGIPVALNRNGGRLEFGPDRMLYISTGDANDPASSQSLESLGGKILRVEPDGSAPSDNPFEDSPVFSYGHRNVQGMSWDSEGRMYASEFGQDTWDEFNRIEAGANYGWPVVEGEGGGPEYTDPLLTWTPAEASPSGIQIVDDIAYVASLRGERIWTVPVGDGEAGEATAVLEGELGRIRTVELAADGEWLWVATSNGAGGDVLMRYPALD